MGMEIERPSLRSTVKVSPVIFTFSMVGSPISIEVPSSSCYMTDKTAEEQLKLVRDECERLRKENERLRSLVESGGQATIQTEGSHSKPSPPRSYHSG